MESPEQQRRGDHPRLQPGTRRLVTRMLHPTRSWDARSDERLKARLDGETPLAEADRAAARRLLVARRIMLGAPANEPSRVEDDRRLDALLDRFAVPDPEPMKAMPTPHPRQALAAWFGGLLAIAAALAVFVMTGPEVPSWKASAGTDDLRSRGANTGDPLVGFGVTGVTESGDEYEVIAADGAFVRDYLRLSYTNDRPEQARYLFIFGLQPGNHGGIRVHWYAPEPDEGRSVPIVRARTRAFDFETRLSTEHEVGPLRFVGIFTTEPLTVPEMKGHLHQLPSRYALGTGFESWLRTRLGLPTESVVQIHDSAVRSGGFVPAPPLAPGPPSPPSSPEAP